MSFTAATILLSDSVKKESHEIAAMLVHTVFNNSISLGLGFAGTGEAHVNNGGRNTTNALHGLRSAFYASSGFPSLRVILSLIFVGKGYWKDRALAQRFHDAGTRLSPCSLQWASDLNGDQPYTKDEEL